jgi:hypothetical protein
VRHLAQIMTGPTAGESERRRSEIRLGWPPAAVLILIVVFYGMKWIPPVPLSMQYGGIYHQVEKLDGGYRLVYPKPPWYRFWRHDSRDFLARPGDNVTCFVRIFAPRRFTHQIYLRWWMKNPRTGRYQPVDRIALAILGGRGQGYRGYGTKSNYEPGFWRVDVETEDGRMIGDVPFTVTQDLDSAPREWRERRM